MNPENLFKIQKARAGLLRDNPFFAQLACQLEPVDKKIGTFGTDGRHIFIDEEFLEKLTQSEIQFIFSHEVLHVAMDHLTRCGARDKMVWNLAIDFATNAILIKEGFKMPETAKGLYDQCFDDKCAEEIYADLMKRIDKLPKIKWDIHILSDQSQPGKDQNSNSGGDKDNNQDQNTSGSGKDDKQDQNKSENLDDILIDHKACQELKDALLVAAQLAKQQGKLPGFAEAMIKDLVAPKINWKKVLYRFLLTTLAKNNFTYTRPNRNYMSKGIVMPTLRSQECEPIGFAIDSSGSISDDELKQFVSELQSFSRLGWNFETHIFVCDAHVHFYQKVRARDIKYDKIKISGRGGTSFVPVFDKIREDRIKIACLIYLTDMAGNFPDKKPDYPVLWVKTTANDQDPPFGQSTSLSDR